MANLYSVKEISEILKISEYAVKKLIKENKLKAFRISNSYKISAISLNVFMGHSIDDCIDKAEFEKSFNEFNELEDGNIDKGKFYEYFCSLFTPGTKLSNDYYLIKKPTIKEPNNKTILLNETEKNEQIVLTKTDISEILESLNTIQKILVSKLT